jgi:hypothetical protein
MKSLEQKLYIGAQGDKEGVGEETAYGADGSKGRAGEEGGSLPAAGVPALFYKVGCM